MGQNNAKRHHQTSTSSKNLKKSQSSVAATTATNASIAQTGNLIISIHMLTMNNSNEVSTSCRSAAATAADCMANNNSSSNTTTDISAVVGSKDQYNNKQQQNNSSEKASSSVYKKFNSKYNKATLVSPTPSSSAATPASSPESNNSATCDNNQSNNNNTSKDEVTTNNFRLSSCPFADKISNMLGSKCKFGSSSSSSTTSKVRKGLLGKFKSSTKQNKQKNVVASVDDSNNILNTSSSSSDSDKTDTPCTHCSGSARSGVVVVTDEPSSSSRGATATPIAAPAEQMSLTYNPGNSVLLPNTSFSITSGGTATTGPNATAIILQDSSLLHTNGWYGSLNNTSGGKIILVQSLFDMTRLSDDSLEDCDEAARIRRARQIAEGVEAPPGFVPSCSGGSAASSQLQTLLCSLDPFNSALRNRLLQQQPILLGEEYPRVHSQADYIHCLVPDLKKITSSVFYWGKMDRYEAEKLLEGKPEGTFLLRDSAQEEYLFSVSFRKYGRSLHARIEQFNHQFSFDSHDPGVYTATTVTGLLEHYKDPSCVMFFEPCLTLPLSRNNAFSLQELARATIVSQTTYDGIDQLSVPKMLKSYLKEYHYKQRVHVKRLDEYSETYHMGPIG